MKIARFIYDWPPPWIGLAPGPFEISRTQVEMGHDVVVFCGNRHRPEPLPGGRVITLPSAIKSLLFFTSAPWLLVRYAFHRAWHGVDLVHGHAHVTQWYNLWRLLFGGRVPYFFHLHVTFAGREKVLSEKGYRFTIFEKIGNRAGKLSDLWGCRAAIHIFAVNESVKREAVDLLGMPSEKITVIRNGVNTALFSPRPKDPVLLSRFGLAPEDSILLYVGVLHARKNLGALLDALVLLPGRCKLLLAGNGPSAYVEQLRADCARLGLTDRVRFAGYVEYPDLPSYYSLADVFVLPSLYEGMPKVLLEALACQKPAIVHAGYALDPGLDAHVDKADCAVPSALAAAVRICLERGPKGRHSDFLKEFSWRAILEQVDTIYRRYVPS